MTIQTHEQARAKAQALRGFLQANGCSLGLRKSLDAIAVIEGLPNWNTLSARLDQGSAATRSPSSSSRAGAAALPGQKLSPATTRLMASLKAQLQPDTPVVADLHFGLTSPQTMSLPVFLLLTQREESLLAQAARGEDAYDHFDADLEELQALLAQAPWSLHPDWGVVPRATQDDKGQPVPFQVQVTCEDLGGGDQAWYWALAASRDGSPVQVNGPYGDLLDLVEALEERFEDIGVAFELNWQDSQASTAPNARYRVCQDHGEYTDVATRLSEAVELARDLRDSGAGGTWTVESDDDARIVAVFR